MQTSQIPHLIWKSLQTQGKSPQPRLGHCAIQYQNFMIIFGGEHAQTHETLCDLHLLNLESGTWIQLQVSGEIPSPRAFHTAVLFKEQMLVWGGYEQYQDGGYIFSDIDLHILDLKTWNWSRITPQGNLPAARSHHSAVLFKDKLFIDGGSYDIYTAYDDLQVLDLTQMCWLNLQVTNRSSSALAGLKLRENNLIKFLGDAAYGGFCGDIWTLDLTDFDSQNSLELQWQKAEFQGIENYSYQIVLPVSSEADQPESGCEDSDEDEDSINWEDGIPYRTVHGYGEFGDNLVLFAGIAPGDGISHITIGDLVMLNLPSLPNNNSQIYHWMIPPVEGEFPSPRFGHSTIQFNNQMIVFGGLWLDTSYGNHSYDNNVYILEKI